MDLNEIRSEIDKIDDELVRLFCQRMHVSAQIADYKKGPRVRPSSGKACRIWNDGVMFPATFARFMYG